MNKPTIFIIILLSIFLRVQSFGQSSATYDITFTSIWNEADHTSVPSGSHWSKLVGATHKTTNTFLQIGDLASIGIKNIAETGNNTVFNTEVSTEITNGEADQYVNGSNLATATGNILISDLVVTEEFPLLTLVSMIAPSPDWIIAINSYNLLDTGGNFKTSVILDVFAYDAGTDSGTDYSSSNIVTDPFEVISMIGGFPINGNKMGTLTITLKTLSIINELPFDQVKIFPNPVSDGNIHIKNLENSSLNKVEIFNVTGSKTKTFNQIENKNTLDLGIHFLPTGIYILKLTDDKNNNLVRKFVVE
ncbi:hypothetical protein BTO04_04405 [Polaribacter sp. SA4-10]|uniref:spondin domain-containing protein n=1 Tax=Polaribacter sp. SA4-10 TaxID=754397 RepID=UPI000B3BE62C|nr:spondin domain-containing protein [Polaribacter sp. SA4-10]ARV05988.1 hypothetical protein BTO04_04405 [Polaribacter sp. SA4-10]